MGFFEAVQLPLLGVGVFVLLGLGVLLGRAGCLWLRRRRGVAEDDGQNHLLSAVMGLLALLLGFTFSLALSRYEDRRALVVQEANAIGTTWLRVQLLEEPNRAAMSQLMRAYLDARIAWSEADNGALAPSEALQARLWTAMGQAVRTDPSAQLSRATMDAMNQSFDLAGERAAEREAHVPGRVLGTLMLYAALSMVMLGYTLAAAGGRHWIATGLVLVLLTLALVLILDLDRPRSGGVQVSQQPLIALRASLR